MRSRVQAVSTFLMKRPALKIFPFGGKKNAAFFQKKNAAFFVFGGNYNEKV